MYISHPFVAALVNYRRGEKAIIMITESIYNLDGAKDLLESHHKLNFFSKQDRQEAPHFTPQTTADMYCLHLGSSNSLNPGIAMPVAFIRRFLNNKELERCNKYLEKSCSPVLQKVAKAGGSVQNLQGIYADSSLVFIFIGLKGDTMLSFHEEAKEAQREKDRQLSGGTDDGLSNSQQHKRKEKKKPSDFLLFKMARKVR